MTLVVGLITSISTLFCLTIPAIEAKFPRCGVVMCVDADEAVVAFVFCADHGGLGGVDPAKP